jgi:hypothetical protein
MRRPAAGIVAICAIIYRSKPATLGALLAGAGGTNGLSGTYDKVGERLRGIPVLAHKFDGTQAV